MFLPWIAERKPYGSSGRKGARPLGSLAGGRECQDCKRRARGAKGVVVRLHELNPPQREAVLAVDGPVLVLAGAGSGKTRVITHRVAHLLDRGVPPDQILAVSFTNKAADEMCTRVEQLVGRARARHVTLCTFHALGLQLLKAERAALGFPSGFTIYDASDQLGAVREILRSVSIEDRRFDSKAILFRISRAKNAFLTPEQYAEEISDHEYDEIAAEVYPKYQEALRRFHALDFDDLITETVRLLDENAEVRARWAARWRFVMVDEYQDTNRAQFHLMNHLVGAHKNICVVGDDDQSIYGWRGAESGHILEFERHFPGAKVVKLEENYRSTPAILDAANAVIAHNPKRHPKRLWTARAPGEPLCLVAADDAEAEAQFVAEEIELLAATRGYKLGDFAVLYRSNVQSRPLEEALRAQRLDYQVVGGQAFFDRKEVKDAIAYLKLALAPRDEISLRRVINYPARGIGATTLERLAAHARAHNLSLFDACRQAREASLFDAQWRDDNASVEALSDRTRAAVLAFCDLVENGRAHLASGALRDGARAYLEAAGLPDELRAAAASPVQAQRRLEHLDGFLETLHRFEAREGRDLAAFLHRLTLQTQDEDDGARTDRVTLVTLHGAKGLEFPVVFLVGLEEELLPHRRTLYPNGPDLQEATVDLGEERRLVYVGITRARERLYLSRARSRAGRGAAKPRAPSRFLDEIPAELCRSREAGRAPAVGAAEADAFARASLAKLLKLTE
jgi:DNA helicase-2/ATP-dependent DNA helicase PcrA